MAHSNNSIITGKITTRGLPQRTPRLRSRYHGLLVTYHRIATILAATRMRTTVSSSKNSAETFLLKWLKQIPWRKNFCKTNVDGSLRNVTLFFSFDFQPKSK
jgi:hypothetical protein